MSHHTNMDRRSPRDVRSARVLTLAHVIPLLAWILVISAVHARERRRAMSAARARHEIRGPLSAARLALDGLERNARVEAIDLELRRAALALDDLVRGGGGGHDRVEPVDVGTLLREAAPAWQALAGGRGCDLAIDPPRGLAVVRGDRMRLAQACANLMANAVEHGGGRVTIRAVAAARRVRIEVADTGPGLPAPIPDLVAAARGRRSPRGHGLAIAAAVAERHGGRLASAPAARGARVVLDLPQAPPEPTPMLARVGLAGTARRAS
jgi:signal transduction histidine kinase